MVNKGFRKLDDEGPPAVYQSNCHDFESLYNHN